MKVLCTGDLHVGRESSVTHAHNVNDCTALGAWGRIVDAALGNGVDAVLIAGDLFDNPAASFQQRGRFHDQFLRLAEAGIPVAAAAGNHDWDSLPAYTRAFPHQMFHLIGVNGWERKEVPTRGGVLAIVGWSFTGPGHTRSPFETYPAGFLAADIGLLHADTVAGSGYAPITAAELMKPVRAWALGHIHRSYEVCSSPLAFYTGSPQALDFGEAGEHGCWILDLDHETAVASSYTPISSVRYESITVKLNENTDRTSDYEIALNAAVGGMLRQGEYLCARVTAHCSFAPGELLKPELLLGDYGSFEAERIAAIHTPSVQDLVEISRETAARGQAARLLLGLMKAEGEVGPDTLGIDDLWIADANKLISEHGGRVGVFWDTQLRPINNAIAPEAVGLSDAEKRTWAANDLRVACTRLIDELKPTAGGIT